VKEFDLEVSVIKWNILPYKQVMAYAFNRQVPGPRIRVTQGDRVRFNVTNRLPEPTSVHWHGMILPNAMDGPADITQKPIEPGQTFTYEFIVQQAGTYFYHSHRKPDRQQALGVYGALIIDPRDASGAPVSDLEYTIQLQEWLERVGYTYPAMLMEGGLPNYFTINGKAYPATDTIRMKVGQKIRLRFIGSNNNFVHPMHVHGGPFKIVETDGNRVPAAGQIEKDTVNVGPGERYDVIWTVRVPGKWLVHCHIPHHTTNNNVEERGGRGADAPHRGGAVVNGSPIGGGTPPYRASTSGSRAIGWVAGQVDASSHGAAWRRGGADAPRSRAGGLRPRRPSFLDFPQLTMRS
jgi:FtsP/CotA-like multicopper oxidase with cupredoxin domain